MLRAVWCHLECCLSFLGVVWRQTLWVFRGVVCGISRKLRVNVVALLHNSLY